jgi:Ca2+-binding RTX toxin-like protein
MTGNAAANELRALGGNDTLNGGSGPDRLHGGTGNDSLKGGLDSDSFYFDTDLDGTNNIDRILDFAAVEDTVVLDRSVFNGISQNGTLSAAAYYNGTMAHDLDDRVIYDQSTGRIFYDADGAGSVAAVLFAQITAGTALTNADFFAVA